MKWSLLGRRCHRALSVCMLFSPCWQNDMTETLLAWLSPLHHTLHHIQIISDSESKISSLQFPLSPPIYRYCSPYWAAVMVGLLSAAHWEKQGRLTSENSSISASVSWLWLRKEGDLYAPQVGTEKYGSPLTTLLLSCDLPHIHYWSSLSVAWLPIDIHAGL